MRKYLLAVSALGMLGAGLSVSAEVDLSALPSEVRSKVEAAIREGEAQQNPIQTYVDKSKETSGKYQSAASSFVAKHAYLKDDDQAKAFVDGMKDLDTDLTTHTEAVSKVIGDATKVQGDLNGMDSLLKNLEDLAFPYRCKTYEGETKKGYVMKKSGSRTEYALYASKNVETKPIAEFLKVDNYYEVGQVGKEGEFSLSSAATNGKEAEFMTFTDGKAVCFVKYL